MLCTSSITFKQQRWIQRWLWKRNLGSSQLGGGGIWGFKSAFWMGFFHWKGGPYRISSRRIQYMQYSSWWRAELAIILSLLLWTVEITGKIMYSTLENSCLALIDRSAFGKCVQLLVIGPTGLKIERRNSLTMSYSPTRVLSVRNVDHIVNTISYFPVTACD